MIRNCILCTKLKAVTNSQLMGELLDVRVKPARPFLWVDIDFAGHFQVKCIVHRSAKMNKCYVAFFVCFSTRACHIELVSDLSAENFLRSLRRFVARRGGLPKEVFSDNGKNFFWANNMLIKS